MAQQRLRAPNVIFVSPGSKSKIFQEAPGLATQAPPPPPAPPLPYNGEVVAISL